MTADESTQIRQWIGGAKHSEFGAVVRFAYGLQEHISAVAAAVDTSWSTGQVENVTPKIRPVVRIRNLGDNGLDWEVKFWLDDYAKHNDTDALVRQRIWYVFQREKIERCPVQTPRTSVQPRSLEK